MIPEGRVRGMGCRLDTAKHAQFQSPHDARTSRRLIALTRAWTWAVGARVRVACGRLRCNECERVHSCEGTAGGQLLRLELDVDRWVTARKKVAREAMHAA